MEHLMLWLVIAIIFVLFMQFVWATVSLHERSFKTKKEFWKSLIPFYPFFQNLKRKYDELQ